MKKFLTSIFLMAAVLLLAENLPDFSKWNRCGSGNLKVVNGVGRAEYYPSNGNLPTAFIHKIPVKNNSFYIIKGKVRRLNADSLPRLDIVSRTADNCWGSHFLPSGIFNSKVGVWQEFEVRVFFGQNIAFAEFVVGADKGKVEFKDFSITQSEAVRFAKDGKFEYWLNMDWGDNVYYCKNLGYKDYAEKEIIKFFEDCKKFGVTGVHWRISALGHVQYHSKGAGTIQGANNDVSKYEDGFRRVVETLKVIDPLAIAVREAKKNGVKLYIWMTLSDEGYNNDIENYATPEFLVKNPDCHLLDRNGNPLKGTICYSDSRAREYRLNIVKELLEYGADGLYLCTRSHSFSFGNDRGDDYGFNKCIVDEYKKRYGVDILTQDFDLKKWRDLKGEGFDKLIKDIAELVHAKGQKVRMGVAYMSLSKNILGSNWGNMTFNWEEFVRQGYVDSIISGHYMVNPEFGSVELNRFYNVAKPHQKIYYWAQLVEYGRGMVPLKEILDKADAFAFLGSSGGIFHQSTNLEEMVEEYYIPLSAHIKKINQQAK